MTTETTPKRTTETTPKRQTTESTTELTSEFTTEESTTEGGWSTENPKEEDEEVLFFQEPVENNALFPEIPIEREDDSDRILAPIQTIDNNNQLPLPEQKSKEVSLLKSFFTFFNF